MSNRPIADLSRRELLRMVSGGFGWLAFAHLATEAAARDADNPLAPKAPHFKPRAKRVIFLCMNGGPSHVDTFDYKPKLIADGGKSTSVRGTGARLLAPLWEFKQRGKSGLWISDLFPEVARHADDLCMIHSMQTDQPAHPQAFLQLHTGNTQFVRPSMGAWILYGLGTENANLPGFISINPNSGNGGPQNYGSGFLPAICQGTRVGGPGQPLTRAAISNIANPNLAPEAQRKQLDLVQSLNRSKQVRAVADPQVDGAIASLELAFRMQTEAPAVMDLNKESPETLAMYGIGSGETDAFGRECLLARRCIEAGVRFVELGSGNWDHHRNLKEDLEARCRSVDKPIAALLTDLKQRGLLKDTLVLWGGEFGRTPFSQGADGRDHNNKGFTMWMAGGGVKAGHSFGSTDDYGAIAVENPVPIHDLHATILHLMGMDHQRLTYRYAGRDFRLTDVHGEVVKGILG